MISPLVKQILVASSIQMAAISVGGLISYPNVLIHQLKSNNSMIDWDLETSSWIGSIHGLAGIPTILMPAFMQWKGRKLAFLISCAFVTIGWILAYVAKSVIFIFMSECFHGLGSNSVLIVSSCCMGEFIDPNYRNTFMVTYFILQSMGIAGIGILGQYLHWKTISLMMLAPVIFSILNACFVWPESPSWLSLKGRYKESERSFQWLRGTNKRASEELMEILSAHNKKVNKVSLIKRLTMRDFYIPAILMFVLLNMMYWGGVLVVMIYFQDIIEKATGNATASSYATIIMNVVLFICYNVCAILVRRFDTKSVLILSVLGTILSALFVSLVTYIQSIYLINRSFLCIYGLIAYIISCTLGLSSIVFSVGMDIMPVKHRDIGGGLYVIYTCILHLTSMKAAPYMFVYLDLWRSFFIYALNATVCLYIVWKYIPETKNRTLQELEDYFTYGKFIKRDDADIVSPIFNESQGQGI
ncbi:hypothetical protein K1T71_012531 [Dendrolimus kikuchii]|uniref:Uncharacterized protein n=1 Tax=Dendrolimus kikuchii TaxID=765133 RepID=A0ACC1CJK0_9NEOP|nr:hypothetical protein K1T71_012531 [Dendrolimus kikuchii]